MNLPENNNAIGRINSDANINISKILINKSLTNLLDSIKPNDILDVKLIDAEISDASFTGILSFNGKLFKAEIPESVYDEFKMSAAAGEGSSTNENFNLRLSAESVNGSDVIFKIINESLDENNLKLFSATAENISNSIKENLTSLIDNNLNLNLNLNINNLTTDIKNNTLILNFAMSNPADFISVLIAPRKEEKDIGKDSAKKNKLNSYGYFFLVEFQIEPLGLLKLSSYYFNRNLVLNFKTFSKTAEILIKQNINMLKEELLKDNIILKDIEFNKNMSKKEFDNEFGGIINEQA
ncbi:MAG: hypothetical protein EVJ46_08380 [Candidatus Acididesulfobacter guangdongensis]|uniref:Flagellar hook-length control protein FliK n=1 Tax=Acididesulfobacter guangdongensis TaxID=2597225 RepID=A0A519BFZ7_ACIG2|nr:MAG: hypothetical protein EVJ46_08380 [Candidatus Acididesulfobacter guangdongensis]